MTVDKARIKVAEGNSRETIEEFATLIDTFSGMCKGLLPLKNEEITPKAENVSQICDYLLSACVYFDLPEPAKGEEVDKALFSLPDKLWEIRKLLEKYKIITPKRGRTGYAKMLNGPGVNNGLRASKRRMKRKDNIKAGELKIIGEQDIDGVHVELSNFDRLSLTDSARKLLHILAIRLTKQIPYLATAEQILKGRRVCLSLDEYMSLYGLTDRKEARKQLINGLEVLYSLSMKWPEKSKIIDPETGKRKYRTALWDTRLLEGKYSEAIIIDNKIAVDFSVKIAEYLSQGYITYTNLQALTIDTNKFRHAYALYFKLYTHYYQNAGKYKHVRLSVESLLKTCPEMPRPEEVSNRHYKQQIIDPFETNMDALQEAGIIASWHYCNSGGEPLTDEQLRDYDFNDWLNWLVEYTLPADCPEPPKPKSHRQKKNTKHKDIAPSVIALPAKSE